MTVTYVREGCDYRTYIAFENDALAAEFNAVEDEFKQLEGCDFEGWDDARWEKHCDGQIAQCKVELRRYWFNAYATDVRRLIALGEKEILVNYVNAFYSANGFEDEHFEIETE